MRATHKRAVRICFAKKYLRIIYKIFTFAKRLRVKYKKIIVTYIPLFNTFKNVMEKIGAEDE